MRSNNTETIIKAMFRTLHFEKKKSHFREDVSFISGLAKGAEDK